MAQEQRSNRRTYLREFRECGARVWSSRRELALLKAIDRLGSANWGILLAYYIPVMPNAATGLLSDLFVCT
jgi:hypothetical protein